MLTNYKFKDLPPEKQESFLKWLEAAMGAKAVEKFKESTQPKQSVQGK